MKKQILFLVSFLVLSFSVCNGQSKKVIENRKLLKDFFLYSCITRSFDKFKMNIDTIEGSGPLYVELLRYGPQAMLATDSLAKTVANSMVRSEYEGRNTSAIIYICTKKYHRTELTEFIRSMDKYMIKDP